MKSWARSRPHGGFAFPGGSCGWGSDAGLCGVGGSRAPEKGARAVRDRDAKGLRRPASWACWLPVWQRGGPGIIICSAGLGGKSFWTLERGEKSIGPAARTLLPPAPLQKGTRRLSSWHVDGNAFQKVSTSSLFFSRGIKFNGGVCLNENEFMIPLAKCPLGTRHRKTSKVGMKIWSAEFFLELE